MEKSYLNRLIANLTLQSEQRNSNLQIRRLFAAAFKTLNKSKSNFLETIDKINKIEEKTLTETSTWIEPEQIKNGGSFDTMDLRHWIELAKLSNVPYIEGDVILTLSEEEYEKLHKEIQIPDFITNSFNKRLNNIIPQPENISKNETESVDTTLLRDKLFTAMDNVPANYMVRSHLCGGNMLKSLAGIGTVDSPDKLFQVDETITVGAGHVTVGNRRMVDATDDRIMKTFVSGHKPEIHFLARPWMKPKRYGVCEDPHRHGSAFAGKGMWPHEWRVFIENNKIVGVSTYYPWIGEVTAENAFKALEAVNLAQKILDTMIESNCVTKHMDTELSRDSKHFDFMNDKFPENTISCTLDFMETEELGMALLEGGPAHTPIGGAHPCGFISGSFNNKLGCNINGVALKIPSDVILADIQTWGRSNSTEKCILTWDEAKTLAYQYEEEKENTYRMKL